MRRFPLVGGGVATEPRQIKDLHPAKAPRAGVMILSGSAAVARGQTYVRVRRASGAIVATMRGFRLIIPEEAEAGRPAALPLLFGQTHRAVRVAWPGPAGQGHHTTP